MSGSLVCVGTGMTLGAHISPISQSHIEQANIVFTLKANGFAQKWLEQMNTDVRCLQSFYHASKNATLPTTKWLQLMVNFT